MTFYLAKRFFRFDGGAEIATKQYIIALERLFPDLCVLSEKAPLELLSNVRNRRVSGFGWTRVGKLRKFGKNARDASRHGILQAHEWVPGANIVRLGGGLHSVWSSRVPDEEERSNPFHRDMVELERQTLMAKQLQLIICNSQMVANEALERYPAISERVAVIPNALQESFIRKPGRLDDEGHRILFVGSGWKRKGLQYLLDAMRALPAAWVLDVYGQDRAADSYRSIVKSYHLENRVRFHGAQPIQPTHYDGAQCLVIPSLYDPFPNVALEALSQGVPVVTSEYTGASDFDGHSGVSVSQLDSEALSAHIQQTRQFRISDRSRFAERWQQSDTNALQQNLAKAYREIGIL